MIYYNFSYLFFMLPAIIIALIAQVYLKSAYNKYSSFTNIKGLTGAQAAERALRYAGINYVRVEPVAGKLTDHFSPKESVIRLSQGVYNSTSIAAIGIACHEVGHAIQYDRGYAPIKLRNAIIPVSNIGSRIGLLIIIVSLVMNAAAYYYGAIFLIIGIALYSLTVIVQLVTLPVEFDASRRAMKTINESGMLTSDECVGARKVLTAAAMTYVAALLQSIMSVLYYVMLFAGRSGRRR